ncbi:hypothetical protein ETD85_38055 [Nonomuraea zeae]|uniref:Uncharacterized protein n=1 Tax=Nonomuraea zeae TaxID=1642303 RepID=A0A5S4G4A9_9ACTN|nr:hypothetical protein ETD85_38055 [Nonomuraea zeae]
MPHRIPTVARDPTPGETPLPASPARFRPRDRRWLSSGRSRSCAKQHRTRVEAFSHCGSDRPELITLDDEQVAAARRWRRSTPARARLGQESAVAPAAGRRPWPPPGAVPPRWPGSRPPPGRPRPP